jgi:hypothetical protein
VEVQVLSSALNALGVGGVLLGNDRLVDARRVGEAGPVGWRARAGQLLAKWTARRTRFNERDLLHAVGLYLFLSRARRMTQMLLRLRRGA